MTRTTILAAMVLIATASPAWASGGYWGPIAGYGTIVDYDTQQATDFTVDAAYLAVSYAPTDPMAIGYLDLSLGNGYDIQGYQDMTEIDLGNGQVAFEAGYGMGGVVSALFDTEGSPDMHSWWLVGCGVSPDQNGITYGGEITFTSGGAPDPPFGTTGVPEPSGFVLIALGMMGVAPFVRRRR